MRHVTFYRKSNGECPVDNFLNRLPDEIVEKITWVIKLVRELDIIPQHYYKKLKGTNNIWEIRVKFGSNIYRLLSFSHYNNFIILTHGFIKKTQKTPKKEIKIAEAYKEDYLRRN